MQYVIAFFAFVAGAFACYWFLNRSRGNAVLVRYDGQVWSAYPARRAAAGVVARTPGGKVTYPYNVLVQLPMMGLRPAVCVTVAADPLVIATHDTLEIGRRGIAFSAMFASGGQLLRYLQVAALIVPLAVGIWQFTTIGALSSQLAAANQSLGAIREQLSKPLVVQK